VEDVDASFAKFKDDGIRLNGSNDSSDVILVVRLEHVFFVTGCGTK
jgi:hypothetical protein